MKTQNTRGFTLIELLVVIAIIALLIGILLPALGTARATAWKVVDGTQIRSLLQGQLQYINDNDEQYAGPNTTGWGDVPGPTQDGDLYENSTSSTTPTSSFDWISPIVGDALNFSVNRAERTANIFNDFADPAARQFYQETYTGSDGNDLADFQEVLTNGRGFQQSSYLSPAIFHLWDIPAGFTNSGFVDDRTGIQARFGGIPYSWDSPINSTVRSPFRYRPRLARVGTQLSNKILIASGTRYLEPSLVLDFDASPVPDRFGSFTSGSPQFINNTAYGKNGANGGLNGENVSLSFRHTGQTLNAGYFDGHVDDLTTTEVWSDPTPWHPTGSIINSLNQVTEEMIQTDRWEQGDEIP